MPDVQGSDLQPTGLASTLLVQCSLKIQGDPEFTTTLDRASSPATSFPLRDLPIKGAVPSLTEPQPTPAVRSNQAHPNEC